MEEVYGAKVAVIEADVIGQGHLNNSARMLEGTGIEVYGEPGEKVASQIVRNGLSKVGTADIVIIDTAGRDSLDGELKEELLEIATSRTLLSDSCD